MWHDEGVDYATSREDKSDGQELGDGARRAMFSLEGIIVDCAYGIRGRGARGAVVSLPSPAAMRFALLVNILDVAPSRKP